MHLDIKPDPDGYRLTAEDVERLTAEATAPLTGLEKEHLKDNTVDAMKSGILRDVANQIIAARMAFIRKTLQDEVARGELPLWIFDPARKAETMAMLSDRGYHFVEGKHPLSGEFRRGETVVGEMKLSLVNPARQ